jgi:Coenzyme PQQ synthesis protein D (PqqD)
MRASGGYTINAPDVVAEDLDGEIVILNLANGHYFSLGGIACAIWSLLLEGHTPQSILASIEASGPDLVDGSSEFINRLIELELIRPRTDADAAFVGPPDQIWSGNGPTIEVYDDLAELIFADPIHDVDEQAGWPTPRQTP